MKRTTIALLFAVINFAAIAQNISEIQWISFEKATKQSLIDGKPIMIDVYTDWCGYCKKMDATTFKNPEIIHYINENFYAVKFDAETKERIAYKDTIYTNSRFVQGQRATPHDLTMVLTNNRPSYPTIVFLVENKGILAPVPGMQTVENLQPLLYYFGEKIYEYTNLWEAFYKGFTVKKIGGN